MKIKLTKKESEILQLLEIADSHQLLDYYPFRYEDNTPLPFSQWKLGERVVFTGILVKQIHNVRYPKGILSRFQLESNGNILDITIFNRRWISKTRPGSEMLIIGKYEGGQKVTAMQYYTSAFAEIYGIQPIYHLKEGINQRQFQRLIKKVLDSTEIKDLLPEYLINRYQLIGRREAIFAIHQPQSKEVLSQAIRRLKYEEFLRFQLAVQLRRDVFIQQEASFSKQFLDTDILSFINDLPFTLTTGQSEAVSEIISDLKATLTMNRLLQGDVGSGKTLVALIAMYAVYLAGFQSAFMAPTEVLAKQHYQYLQQFLSGYDLKLAVLYAAMNNEEKETVRLGLADGSIDIVVGTHALIQEMVEFARLGLVITDEQQRFGVKQRLSLKDKGKSVDFMMMSATPIPRTLASAYYGDMEVSNIIDKPAGRLPIATEVIPKNSMFDFFPFLIEHLRNNERCYVICASIEESDSVQIRNVQAIYQGIATELQNSYHNEFQAGLLHGKMKSEERDVVMQQFKDGNIQLLVSTTVIEVGVDVPEATIMVVYDAERFGMSQLHQLRGRIGRSDKQSYCFLLTDSRDSAALARLEVLRDSNDGFFIAEMDLKLRGPGDILGTRQSGLPGFILGDIMEDSKILETARNDALELLENSDFFEKSDIFVSISDRIDNS